MENYLKFDKKVNSFSMFNNVKMYLNKYVLYIQNLDEVESGRRNLDKHYIIEFIDEYKKVYVFETSEMSWNSIKNYLRIGTGVISNGQILKDINGNSIFNEILSFGSNNIKISKDSMSSKYGTTEIGRKIFTYDFKTKKATVGNKFIFISLIIIALSLLMSMIIKFSILVFFIMIIILAIYASVENKKIGMSMDKILEKNGFCKTEQEYTQIVITNSLLANYIEEKIIEK